jgi:hypothetical protein
MLMLERKRLFVEVGIAEEYWGHRYREDLWKNNKRREKKEESDRLASFVEQKMMQ